VQQRASRSGAGASGLTEVTWLGHSTVLLDLDGVRLLTDPLLRRHAGPLRRRGAPPGRAHWEAVDAVLLSHLHHDHAELASLRLVREVPVLTAPENAAWLRRRGITSAVGLGDDEWFTVGAAGGAAVEVRLTTAYHHHRPMPHRPNAAHGHLVRGPAATVWAAGDTSLYEEMAQLRPLAGGTVDLAVVPVGGWGPRLSEGHMDAAQAATACARVGARRALAVHWGTLHPPLMGRWAAGWIDRPLEHFTQALEETAPDCRLVRLLPGQTWRPEPIGR
jgi:L-ascorbate metabolism protein UlaG (beta-lactamase superfamily)